MEFIGQYKAARRVSTPLVAIRTFDSKSTIDNIKGALGEKLSDNALILWDCLNGFRSITKNGVGEISHLCNGTGVEASIDLSQALRLLEQARENVTVFVSNSHLFWTEPGVIQGIWNLRDGFKAQGNMLVLLMHPGGNLPPELVSDTLVLDEPLPTPEQIRQTVSDVCKFAKLPEPDAETLQKSADALIGLPAFPAEQSAAMCIDTKAKKIDIPALWAKKREVISQTPGLSVWEAREGLDAIGGLATLKGFIRRVMTGRDAPKCIIFTDEIEKAFAGTGTDMSGVKTELTGSMLSWTQDRDMDGILELGFPGCGKSQLAKNAGYEFGVPVINFDLAGMQGGIIGQSGANLRAAQKTIDTISSGRVLWLGTCNSIDALPPELRDRFKLGTFFIDAPDVTERAAIWNIYRKTNSVPDTEPTPNDEGWTGRQIRECCQKAYRLRMTLSEAAAFVVPLSKSAPERIEALRLGSSGKYLSASHPGLYLYNGMGAGPAQVKAAQTQTPNTAGRVLRFDEE